MKTSAELGVSVLGAASGADVKTDVDLGRIDRTVESWRQGDCVVGSEWFMHRIDIDAPLTSDAEKAVEEGSEAAGTEVYGLMVATQTCDIVRSCARRPFIEVCPLVKVEPSILEEIRKARRPQFAYVPGVAEQLLVADLDRTMTVEKSVVASWRRTIGCECEDEQRRLANALARKRSRPAFPTDFGELVRDLLERLKEKHGRQSAEGEALRALREIRVRAAPSWSAEDVELTFWFIRDEPPAGDEAPGEYEQLEEWLKLVPAAGRFTNVQGTVMGLQDLTAKEYVESDRLDLDYLSDSTSA